MGILFRLRILHLIVLVQFLQGVVMAQEPITIGQKMSLHSAILDQDREIWISLPASYSDSTYSKKDYPVCYFFDGDSHFENLVAQGHRLSSGLYASIPEMIMVGIIQQDRTKELTPTAMATPDNWKRADFSSSGGNGLFMEFIEQELKPLINQTYRTNSFEVLIGHSFGGLSVSNTLLNHPDFYDAYVAIDPSVWWDDQKLLSNIDSLWKVNLTQGKLFYLAKADDVGSGEDHHRAIIQFNEDINRLNEDNSLHYRYKFYEKEDHGTVVVPAEYDALRFIFEGYQLPVKQLMKQPDLLDGHFYSVSERLGYKIIPDEKTIDDLAKVCQRQDLHEQALELLRRNTVYYPGSGHARRRYQELLDE